LNVTHKDVAKRFSISLPDGIAEHLEEWATSEGNKPTTLAAFLVERAVRERIERLEASQANQEGK
jgi:metal-responsive CopG/Arc/MetJ family transcriptional regulator